MEVLRKKPLKGRIIVKSRLNWVTANGNIAQAMSAMKEDGISLVNIGEFSIFIFFDMKSGFTISTYVEVYEGPCTSVK